MFTADADNNALGTLSFTEPRPAADIASYEMRMKDGTAEYAAATAAVVTSGTGLLRNIALTGLKSGIAQRFQVHAVNRDATRPVAPWSNEAVSNNSRTLSITGLTAFTVAGSRTGDTFTAGASIPSEIAVEDLGVNDVFLEWHDIDDDSFSHFSATAEDLTSSATYGDDTSLMFLSLIHI